MSTGKKYLGDGVYAEVSNFDIVLTTENDTIHLDPDVLEALFTYLYAQRVLADLPQDT